EWAKVTQTVPADYAAAVAKAQRDAPRDPAVLSQIYSAYEQLKRDRSVIDFEDVLLLMVGILQDRGDIADHVRGQYQHFVVDEY
ncbi:UvrD-helicase domain-containing protein, partial [Streptomyces sp. SID7982]|nr:UvrD-helicase domain-containing protein [Streptomyces sp. SID7982]